MVGIFALLAFAYSAGLAASLNPCGFVILPALLSKYFTSKEKNKSRMAGVLSGMFAGTKVTLGFMTIFIVIGVVISFFSTKFASYVPWLNLVLAAALIAFGSLSFFNKMPPINIPVSIHKRLGGTNSLYNYGMLYGFTSFGCTLPIFLAVVVGSIVSSSFLEGVLVFLFYTLGMGTVIIGLTTSIASSRRLFERYLKKILPHSKKINAVIFLIIGIYLIYRVKALYFI